MKEVKDLTELVNRLRIMARYNRRPDQREEEIVLLTAAKVIEEMASTEWNVFSEKCKPEYDGDYLCIVLIPSDHGGFAKKMQVLHWYGYNGCGWVCTEMIVTHWRNKPPEPLGSWVFHSSEEESEE